MNRFAKISGFLLAALIIGATIITLTGKANAQENENEFVIDNGVLVSYAGTDETVSVPSEVTEIGLEAFRDNTTMKEVVLPEGLLSIGYQAFQNCVQLEEVVLPDTVISVDAGAFSGCSNLQAITIGEGLSQWGTSVLGDCDQLSSITVDDQNTSFVFSGDVLYNGDMTHVYQMLPGSQSMQYTMPATVESIEPYAFYGCSKLVNVVTSGSMQEIPAYAFSNCPKLLTVSLSESTKAIDLKAFENCEVLTQVYIPSATVSIHETAFDGCPNVSIYAEEDTYAQEYAVASGIPYLSEPILAATIVDSNLPQSQDETDTAGDDENTSQDVLDGEDVNSTLVVADGAFVIMDNTKPLVDTGVNLRDEDWIDPSIIPSKEYWGQADLVEYDIDSMVTKVGDFAFARSGLASIQIPDSVIDIGYAAFYHCDGLYEVSIPDSVQTIGEYAFSHTPWLSQWMEQGTEIEEEEYLVVGDGVLIAYKGVRADLHIPTSVKKIAPGTFRDHTEIQSIALPSGLLVIGQDAFSGCSALSMVTGISETTVMESGAFYGTLVSADHLQ